MSAKKSKGGRTGDGGAYIKPLLIQAAWAAVRVPGRLQARFHRLVRKFGGPRNKGAQKRAITAIAHTLEHPGFHAHLVLCDPASPGGSAVMRLPDPVPGPGFV
jgi:hypothetical protein